MKVLVMGANTNPEKYAYKAITMLKAHGHEVNGIGLRPGNVAGVDIDTEKKNYTGIDTITLYLNAKNQQPYYDYFLQLKPRRVIFNPGTENPELENLLKKNGIKAEEACTLVLLGTGQF